MEVFLVIIFFLGACWDVATSFLGIVGLFGVFDFDFNNSENIGIYATAFVGSLIILGLSLNTEAIYEDPPRKDIYPYLIPVHALAILFDAYTSFLGNAQFIILKKTDSSSHNIPINIDFSQAWEQTSLEQKFILIFLTMAVTISPIIFAKLIKE